MMGELSYFLDLHVNQQEKGIFISQVKYVKEMLKKFNMEDNKPLSTPMKTSCKLSKMDTSPNYPKFIWVVIFLILLKRSVLAVRGSIVLCHFIILFPNQVYTRQLLFISLAILYFHLAILLVVIKDYYDYYSLFCFYHQGDYC